MCGRFTLTTPAQAIAEAFGVAPPADLAPRYNIAPGQDVLAVRERRDGGRELATLRWGLVPWWSKELPRAVTMINARADTAPERPAFRDAFRRHRCLIPASGFYEWQPSPGGRGGPKQPYLIGLHGGAPFAFAGLWDRWRPPAPDEPPVESCAIVTTDANPLVHPIHDRMPVILPVDAWPTWLDRRVEDVERLKALLRPYPAGEIELHPVSPWVNDARHDDARCIEPVARFEAPKTLFD
ncbi:MAG TPA: SOS response-associated peptidase [Candidatus Binatia bacterium]|nr:SOS response-associated peptidase [Candidatus Binatia bacterium]